MIHKPLIPNNVHYWKIFEDDEQIKHFLENQNDPVWIMQEGENPEEFKDRIQITEFSCSRIIKFPRVLFR